VIVAVVSQRSYICTGSHDYTSPTFDIYAKKIVIEAEAWVATDVIRRPRGGYWKRSGGAWA
jgi:putative colanic acid biosynthesis acetyltransferase WcaF